MAQSKSTARELQLTLPGIGDPTNPRVPKPPDIPSGCDGKKANYERYIDMICNQERSDIPCLGPDEKGAGERHLWVFILIGIVALALIASRLFHRRWQKLSRQRQDHGDKSTQNKAVVDRFVLRFVPDLVLEQYQFTGMKKNKTGIALDFKGLGLKLKTGQTVLAGVTGCFDEGKMVAVMGPSGCGKSTFLNVLCGKATYGDMTGEIKINGSPGNMKELKPIMGFVPQDDTVHERLTVREQIRYSAELRMPRGTHSTQFQHVVKDTLNVLQITHIQRSIVGGVEDRGISGGQRKRVNIGLELAACPSLLFLDEPTSGLDSTSSLMIINSLKKMTSLNMTIIMVIHQPRYSLFTLFDTVLLLGKGGLTCYLGPSKDAVGYFESLGFQLPANENPADWLMDVLSGAVSNSSKHDFELADLVQSWEKLGPAFLGRDVVSVQGLAAASAEAQAEEEFGSAESIATRKEALATDDRERTVRDLVEEEWAKIDTDGNRVMDFEELHAFMHGCMDEKVDDDCVHHVMNLIAKSSGGTVESIGKDQLVAFLCNQAKALAEMTADCTHKSHPQHASSRVNLNEHLSKVFGAVDQLEDGLGNLHRGLASGQDLNQELQLTRKVPGVFQQFRIIFHRRMVQWWGQIKRRCIDLSLVVFCSLAMALMSLGDVAALSNTLFMHLGLVLLSTVSALKTFTDRPIFWRESGRGVSALAFFTARTTADLFDMLNQTVTYTALFYLITQPPVGFQYFFVPCFLSAFVASGWGYLLSALIPPESATIAGVVLMLLLGGLLAQPDILTSAVGSGGLMDLVVGLSPTRWSLQMFFIRYHDEMGGLRQPEMPICPAGEVERMDAGLNYMAEVGKFNIGLNLKSSFEDAALYDSMGNWGSGIFVLCLEGILLRIGGFLCLKYTHRDKQV